MPLSVELDDIDLGIIQALKKDAKITVKALSERLDLSPTPIYERIKKMERSGVIRNYTITVDEAKMGKTLVAFAHISLRNHTRELYSELENNLLSIPEIIECHAVSGSTDFIIKILVEDMDDYKKFIIEKLFDVPNIGKVESFISLNMNKK